MANRFRRKFWRLVTALALLLAAAGGTVWGLKMFHNGPKPLQPPEVNLQGLEPEAAGLISSARQAVLADLNSGSAWGKLGQVLVANDFFDQGAASLAEAERLEPYEPRWPYLRGRALQEEKPGEALPELHRAASMVATGNPAPRLTLAEFLTRRGGPEDLTDAAKLAKDVLDQDPSDARALLDLGRIEHARGQDKESLEHLNRSFRLAPEVSATYALMANVQERLGQHAQAELSLRRGATLPDDAAWPDPFVAELVPFRRGERADLEMGRALLAANRNAELVAFAQKTSGKYPKNPMAWEQLGTALAKMDQLPQAEEAFRNATKVAPDSLRPLLGLILTLGLEHKYREVQPECRKAIALRADAGEPHYYLGAALAREGKWENAIAELREAVRLRPDVVRFRDGLGEALLKTSDPEAAATEFRESLKLDPADPLAKHYLGATGTPQLPR